VKIDYAKHLISFSWKQCRAGTASFCLHYTLSFLIPRETPLIRHHFGWQVMKTAANLFHVMIHASHQGFHAGHLIDVLHDGAKWPKYQGLRKICNGAHIIVVHITEQEVEALVYVLVVCVLNTQKADRDLETKKSNPAHAIHAHAPPRKPKLRQARRRTP
jgi:hypothetical protein